VVDLGGPISISWQYQNNWGIGTPGDSAPRYGILKVNYDQYSNEEANPDGQVNLQRSIGSYYTTNQITNQIPQDQQEGNIYLRPIGPVNPGLSNLNQQQPEVPSYQIYQNLGENVVRPLIEPNQVMSQPSVGIIPEPIPNQPIKPVQEETLDAQNVQPLVAERLVNNNQLPRGGEKNSGLTIDELDSLLKLIELGRVNQKSNPQIQSNSLDYNQGLSLQDVRSPSYDRRGNNNLNSIGQKGSLGSRNIPQSIRTANIQQGNEEVNPNLQRYPGPSSALPDVRSLEALRARNTGLPTRKQNPALYSNILQDGARNGEINRDSLERHNQNSQKSLLSLRPSSALSGVLEEPSAQAIETRNTEQPSSELNGGLRGNSKQIPANSNQREQASRGLSNLLNAGQTQQELNQRQRTQYGYSELSAKILEVMRANPSMNIEKLREELQVGSSNPQINQLKNLLQEIGKNNGNIKTNGAQIGPQNNLIRNLVEIFNKNGLNLNTQYSNGRWRH